MGNKQDREALESSKISSEAGDEKSIEKQVRSQSYAVNEIEKENMKRFWSDEHYLEHMKHVHGTEDEELIDKIDEAQSIPLSEMYLEQLEAGLFEGKNITKGQLLHCLQGFPDSMKIVLPSLVRKRLCEVLRGENIGGRSSGLVLNPFVSQACLRFAELRERGEKRIVALDLVAEEFKISSGRVEQLLAEHNKSEKK